MTETTIEEKEELAKLIEQDGHAVFELDDELTLDEKLAHYSNHAAGGYNE